MSGKKLLFYAKYLFVGAVTSLINVVVYYLLYKANMHYMLANTIAWFVSVLFAYFANRGYVFGASKTDAKGHLVDFSKFTFGRVITLIIDNGLMWLGITVLLFNNLLVKLTVQVIIIILNYVFSKIVFVKGNKTKEIG